MIGDYQHKVSFLHRAPPGAKIFGLMAAGTALFFVSDLAVLGLVFAATLILYQMAGLSLGQTLRAFRPFLAVLVVIFLAQLVLQTWQEALAVVARFATLLLLAHLVTLTTTISAMIAALTRGLRPIALIGISPAKISLALSLALRFLPVLSAMTNEVREAQKARGLEHSILAMAVPLIVRTLKAAEDIADAIESRGYNPDTDMRLAASVKARESERDN